MVFHKYIIAREEKTCLDSIAIYSSLTFLFENSHFIAFFVDCLVKSIIILIFAHEVLIFSRLISLYKW